MMVVGVTGRIGSGKSTLCALLAGRHGCAVIDADALGHEALRDPVIRDALVAHFGPEILGRDGEIDRGAVAGRVFDDPLALRTLESITHAWIVQRIRERVACLRQADPAAIVLIDAALLLSWIDRLPIDRIVWVRASEDVSIGRLRARGVTEQEARRRVARQSSEETFRARADAVIENSGGLEDLAAAAEGLWTALTKS
jgi:dephospho-CoA kinase